MFPLWSPSFIKNFKKLGTSLVVQWLRPCASNAGSPGLTPVQGLRSHMSQEKIHCAAPETWHSQINKNKYMNICLTHVKNAYIIFFKLNFTK